MYWFALTVKPQHERSVVEQLTAKSLEGYVPVYAARHRWSDRVKTVSLPLFPRYVFCRFRFEERQKVLSIFSVTSIVGFGGTPCPVSQEEIDTIKRIIGSNLPIMPWPFLRIGQPVRISEGPLSGVEGILAREKAAFRVVVSVEMLQRAVAVEVERDSLEVIGSVREPTPRQQLNPANLSQADRRILAK